MALAHIRDATLPTQSLALAHIADATLPTSSLALAHIRDATLPVSSLALPHIAAPETNRKVRICCSLPVAKRKSIKKQGILKQPLSTPGVHKSVQIQVKNDEKIKHNGISHIF